jgi:hypothetical protein
MGTLPLTDAAREIRFAIRENSRRHRRRSRLETPIRVIDAMLDELEMMNLVRRRRVPLAWEPRLQLLLLSVPEHCRRELRSNISPNRLMDMLYEMQDELLTLKLPVRASLRELDAILDAEFAAQETAEPHVYREHFGSLDVA